ncbi:MAG TPA: hypothetical protein VIL65_09465 [Beijerinckiaceae bacterium]|jgi:hypothetical protein
MTLLRRPFMRRPPARSRPSPPDPYAVITTFLRCLERLATPRGGTAKEGR